MLKISCVSWIDSSDIHLLKDTTAIDRLLNNIYYIQLDGEKTTDIALTDIRASSLKFSPNLKGSASTVDNLPVHSGHGVLFLTQNGKVYYRGQVGSVSPLRSFIVAATLETTGGTKLSLPPIRIHLHDTIEKVWLTPSSLTIRNGSTKQFTVLARFDDGTVADITDWPRTHELVDWSVFGNPVSGTRRINYNWSIMAPLPSYIALETDPDTSGTNGRIISGQSSSPLITVGLQLPTEFGMVNASPITGTVICAPPWSTRIEAKLVAGDETRIESRRNAVFVPDGFTRAEIANGDFDAIVQLAVNSCNNDRALLPYPLLKDSINYWRVHVESPEPAATLLPEFYLVEEPPYTYAAFVQGGAPRSQRTSTKLQNLILQVGLPVPKDDKPGAAKTLTEKKTIWDGLYSNPEVASVDQLLYEGWLSLHTRTLLNEPDTAFGMECNERPRVASVRPWKLSRLTFSDRRLSWEDIEAFLGNIYTEIKSPASGTKVNVDIGRLRWLAGMPDDGLVCFISRNTLLGGTSAGGFGRPGHVAVSLPGYSGKKMEVVSASPGGGMRIVAQPLPTQSSMATIGITNVFTTVVVHEWAHSFAELLDEYGGRCGLHTPPSEQSVLVSNNIVSRHALEKARGTLKYLDANEIKWSKWHRIRSAAILLNAPVTVDGANPDTSKVRVQIASGIEDIEIGAIIRLRRQDLTQKILPQSDPPVLDPDSVPYVTGRFKCVARPAADVLELERIDATSQSDLLKIRKGDHLIVPALEKSATRGAGAELLLMSKIVYEHIKSTERPLTAPTATSVVDCDPGAPIDNEERQSPTNMPIDWAKTVPKKPKDDAQIIGLYEGGGGKQCDYYRPAGVCKMRGGGPINESDPDRYHFQEERAFCQVCRYAIINKMDPTKHGLLDAEYDKVYLGPDREKSPKEGR
jgi:IgA Peptidase M64